jgi:putative ABC transport system substrate-binding protein
MPMLGKGVQASIDRLSRRDLVVGAGRWTVSAAGLALLGGCQLLRPPASTPSSVRRIGYLSPAARAPSQSFTEAFVDRLHQLGWSDGENLAIEWRFAEGHDTLIPDLAAQLVSLPVEILVAAGAASALPAHQQTTTIPIVLVSVGDLAVSELVQNLAHPTGNVTGVGNGTTTYTTKSAELLKTVLPQLSRIALFGDPTVPAYTSAALPTADAARTLGLDVQILDVDTVDDVDKAFAVMPAGGVDALLVTAAGPYFGAVYGRISELAADNHLPAMFQSRIAVTESGGLMSFNEDIVASYRLVAEYVDKILRGATPADLPTQEPREWQFIVNVKAAQALGITFPPDAAAQVTQWFQE